MTRFKLTPEEKQQIDELRLRKLRVGFYGDDSGVMAEKREIQAVINRIKANAQKRAEGLDHKEKVVSAVPWNVHLD